MYERNFIVLNQRYGYLVPITGPIRNHKKEIFYECRCDCGNTKIIRKDALFHGRIQSCGCLKHPDLIGKKFNMLTVISFFGRKKRDKIWLCKCDCGNEKKLPTEILKTQISCGCIKYNKGRDNACYKGFEDLSASHWNKIKARANKEGHKFCLDIKDGWELFIKQRKKCALTGIELQLNSSKKCITTASLDRINSFKGYEPGNVQWVHKRINKMKLNDSDKEFINWCKLVTEYNKP